MLLICSSQLVLTREKRNRKLKMWNQRKWINKYEY